MSTLRDTRGVVSANTEGQLRTKTWPELAKWHGMSRNKAWCTYTATALHSAEPGRDKTWRVDAIDFIRVRVRAVFPRAGSLQFVDGQRVDEAVARPLVEDPTAPLIMGVDIARQGVDPSVIRFRWGLDARSIPAVKFRIPDLMQVASRVMEQVNSHNNPDAVFIDGTGIGWGVLDRLNQLGCPNVSSVDFGARPTAPTPRCATPTSAPRCGAS